jgi:Lower baseplate protein N-terminal domain
MAFTWTKSWSSTDDGSVLGGNDLDNIQNDLDAQAMQLANDQTITGNKTFSGTNTHSGTNTLSGINTFSNTNTFTGQVVFTNKSVITCLSTTTGIDMKTSGVTALYTIPTGKTMCVTHVVVRDPSATLAGGTDYDFGTSAACSSWRQTVDLQTMTATTDVMVITPSTAVPVKYTNNVAASIFAIKVSTGSTGAATATVDLFGYLY